jgi:hypothetical protein
VERLTALVGPNPGRHGAINHLPGGGRYIALDSLRGVAACLVVLFHASRTGWLG